MPSPLGLAVKLAFTPTGRRLIRHTVKAARSKQARKLLSDAQKLATGPTAQRLLNQAKQTVQQQTKVAAEPPARQRAPALRHRLRKRKLSG